MKKILVALTAALAFCGGQPAQAGVGFGIPLPFPFLVWTPSGHCGEGSCSPRGHECTKALPKSAETHVRTPSTAKASIGVPKAVVGVGTAARVPIIAERK
jgi:hypothetical protein